MSQKQVMPKSEDLSRSLEINAIWTFDTEFPTIFNKSCTHNSFKQLHLCKFTEDGQILFSQKLFFDIHPIPKGRCTNVNVDIKRTIEMKFKQNYFSIHIILT